LTCIPHKHLIYDGGNLMKVCGKPLLKIQLKNSYRCAHQILMLCAIHALHSSIHSTLRREDSKFQLPHLPVSLTPSVRFYLIWYLTRVGRGELGYKRIEHLWNESVGVSALISCLYVLYIYLHAASRRYSAKFRPNQRTAFITSTGTVRP